MASISANAIFLVLASELQKFQRAVRAEVDLPRISAFSFRGAINVIELSGQRRVGVDGTTHALVRVPLARAMT
jgi:hypothetical protein